MKFYFNIACILFFFTMNAQNYLDLANISYSNTNFNRFENNTEKTRIEDFGWRFNFPIVLNKKNTLLTGLYGSRIKLKLDSNLATTSSVYMLGVKLGINQIYSKKWAATYFLLPLIASDFANVSTKDFQIGLLALFNYTKRENLHYKFGLYGHTELFGPQMVPLLGLYYTSLNEKWEIDLILPIVVDVNYELFKKINIGINFDGLGSTYNLNKSFAISDDVYVVKNSNELFSYLRFQFGKSIYFKAKVGYSFFRSYRVYDQNEKVNLSIASIYLGDNRNSLNNDFKDGAIYKFELIYRIHFK